MNPTQEPVRYSAIVYALLAGAFFWGMDWAWRAGQTGSSLAALGALLLAYLGLKNVLQTLAAVDVWRERRRIERAARQSSDRHGRAQWAKLKELKRAGMTRGKGLFLGSLNRRDVYYPGEASLLTIAPPGAGKGTSIAIPNLLTHPGSMVVTDPKGELYAVTARHRREKLKHRIIVLCPWWERMGRELGIQLEDAGYNPLSFLVSGPEIKDETELVAALLCPNGQQSNASEEFWNDFGRSILTCFMLDLISRLTTPNLTDLRRELMRPPTELHESLLEMAENQDWGGCIAETASKLLGNLKNAPEMFEGGLASAQRALRIYDRQGPLGQHVAKGGFDFASLKEIPTTVYLIIPSDRIGTHAAWLNTIISLALETVGRDRSNRRVLFLLDEVANLGALPVLRAMALYRGQGVQVWTIWQQTSQIERLYGKPGLHEFLGLSEVINTFGVWEPETIKLVAEWLGKSTVKDFSHNVSPEVSGARTGTSYQFGASNQEQALLRPEDVRTLPADEQLILYRNLPAIRAKKVSYLERRQWRKLADPNPYHRFT